MDKCGEILEWIMSTPEVPDDEMLQFKIRLCAEEAVENIVRYAYGNGSGYLEATTDVEDGMFVLNLKDSGIPFNPLEKDDPDIDASLEDRQVGGLGIFLCKQMMDDVLYHFAGGCNNLTLKKKIN